MVVAQLGTVRAASKSLGIHRATVTRHIDALEKDLGTRLFLRHQDGYTLTADGMALRGLAASTDRLIAQFVRSASETSEALHGTLRISTLVRAASILAPAIRDFCDDHPQVSVQLIAESGLSRLELGNADIAIRTGPKPNHPDYVVRQYQLVALSLCGHKSYFEKCHTPVSTDDLSNHRFVGIRAPTGAVDVCEVFGVRRETVAVSTNDPSIALSAVEAGIGLGMIANVDIDKRPDLFGVLPSAKPRQAEVWIVTHVDLHRSRMVRTFLSYLRSEQAQRDRKPTNLPIDQAS